MYAKTITIAALAGTIALGALLSGAGAAGMGLKSSSLQNGDCKNSYEAVIGPNAPTAQAIWTSAVAAKYGNKWAIWAGAKNKAVTPVAGSGGKQFQARAIPCFYQPVP